MARVTAALALVLVMGSGASAETPTDALRQVFAHADTILGDPRTAERPLERLLAIRKLVNEAFDFPGAAALASGDHWRARTAAEQEEFTWLFGDLLERSFVSRMASQANLRGGTRIRYLGVSMERGTALVRTAMARRDGGEMRLDYRLIEREASWKIRDVAIDGVSLMANYRAQLDRVLGNASFPELLTQMRAMVGAGDAPAPTAPPAAVRPAPVPTAVEVSSPASAASTPAAARTPAAPEPPAPSPARTLRTRAYWLQLVTDGGKRIVRVGPFRDAEAAVLKLLDLQARGHDPSLIAERE